MKRLISIVLLLALPALADVQTVPGRQVKLETNAWVNLKENHVGIYTPSNPVPTTNCLQYVLNWIDSQWGLLVTNVSIDAATNTLWQWHVADRFDDTGVLRNTNVLSYFPNLDTNSLDDITNVVGGAGVSVLVTGGVATVSLVSTSAVSGVWTNYTYDAQSHFEVRNNVSQDFLGTASLTYYQVQFGQEIRDPLDLYSPTQHQFVPRVNGVYDLAAGVLVGCNAGSSDQVIKLHLFKAGSVLQTGSTGSRAAASAASSLYISATANYVGYLTTNDAVTVYLNYAEDQTYVYVTSLVSRCWFNGALLHQITY